eukprot:CAMPEP_0201624070 /NCGR_PEP_ID=MMETSP0493-20130528/382_1 /ASSEMBLY_ACC=CAM_ASM_000838 /TAXON_ID=420259 /ORGANISM="Thalassiosira gravida, Strain GMp14c1" /LENGTH=70 /DNA_ID=CAMNT_0048093835 /DNA_START=135 /DNA_END=347 /DNA_ORIENTATION=-
MASVGRNLLRRSLAQARTHDSADASTSDGHAPYTPAQLIVAPYTPAQLIVVFLHMPPPLMAAARAPNELL